MDSINEQQFRVRDLPTRSVTLFPSRAQVVREIKNVALKLGPNQITVVGFTSHTDENSFKIDGTGSAVVSDMTVKLLKNTEQYEDVYSDSDDEESTTDDDSDDDAVKNSELYKPTAELKQLQKKLADVQDEERAALELVASAENRMGYLDAYGKQLDRKRGIEIDVGLAKYREERARAFADKVEGQQKLRALAPTLADLREQEDRLKQQQDKQQKKAEKAKARARRLHEKVRRKERALRLEKQEKKRRVRKEREALWDKSCYTVCITLDVSDFSPTTSRRSSMTSLAEITKPMDSPDTDVFSAGGDLICDLSISYVTQDAFWEPTYDLQLSTTKKSAVLCFDANLTNKTSETWRNCKVVLSTSQTTFSGINDVIPTLQPWHVKLTGNANNGLEQLEKNYISDMYNYKSAEPPNRLHGKMMVSTTSPPPPVHRGMQMRLQAPQTLQQQAQQMQQEQQMKQMMMQQQQQVCRPMPARSRSYASVPRSQAAAHSPPAPVAPAPAPAPASTSLFSLPQFPVSFGRSSAAAAVPEPEPVIENFDFELTSPGPDVHGETATLAPAPELEYTQSVYEESGLTATYDLPGFKTLAPSLTKSKQRIARVTISAPGAVTFSHTVVAKLRPAAFLRTKIKNLSKLTLLRGTAGLTLDGSFIGRATMPRCSAGDSFFLNLGVDPAVRVVYPPADIKRSAASGIFSKENMCSYNRSITLTNTHAAATTKPIHLLVIDQVPVSEDDRLRVDVQQPQGLALGGKPVVSGTAVGAPGGAEVKTATTEWGSATATLKKVGEIEWDVQLNPGWSTKLELRYDVSAPVGEGVTQV